MSLEVWLKRSAKVQVGGRDLILVPLPLSRLVDIGHWVEENANAVVAEVVEELKAGKEAPNPMALITKVLLRVNSSEVALQLFCRSRDPNTKELLNKGLDKEFFDEYLDVPTLQELIRKFIEINQLEDLAKNLWSLPAVKNLIEAAMSTYGIPFLNSLRQSTASVPKKSEGSLSLKSTDMSQPATSEKQESGISQIPPLAQMEGELLTDRPSKKEWMQ